MKCNPPATDLSLHKASTFLKLNILIDECVSFRRKFWKVKATPIIPKYGTEDVIACCFRLLVCLSVTMVGY